MIITKILTYKRQGVYGVGAVKGKGVVDLTDSFPTVLDLIRAGDKGWQRARELVANRETAFSFDALEIAAPIPVPHRNLICVGWNYLAHFNERFRQDIQLPDKPVLFTKATTTVTGPNDEVVVDPAFTTQLDFEVEVAIVIGKGGRKISEADALDHVFGYTVANDVTARDVQRAHGGQWFVGKSMDTSCPLGPYIVTSDEIPDPQSLEVSCSVNGVVKQKANTSLMIFPIKRLIAEISQGMTLEPGDILLTGTPEGTGSQRKPPEFLQPGDVIESAVDLIGGIRNTVMSK